MAHTESLDTQDIEFLDELTSFLTSPNIEHLLTIHPNQTTLPDFARPASWTSWWDWASDVAGTSERKWLQLWRYYIAPQTGLEASASIPEELRRFVDECRSLQFNREPGTVACVPSCTSQPAFALPLPNSPSALTSRGGKKLQGMSPKKTHEVRCMTQYTSRLLSHLSHRGTAIKHVVDVGAGQVRTIPFLSRIGCTCWERVVLDYTYGLSKEPVMAYVTRALRDELGLDILAVDWSPVQTEGAARRDKSRTATEQGGSASHVGSLTYKMLPIDEESLLRITDEWTISASDEEPTLGPKTDQLPVMFLALHACGSLTLDILRAFSSRVKATSLSCWKPAAALIVGCCYNLLQSADCTPLTGRRVLLSPNHLQLAAQVPKHWNRTLEAFQEAQRAVRKVAWRALLESIAARAVQSQACEGVEAVGISRLGRLNDAAYQDWSTFLSMAKNKLRLEIGGTVLDSCMESRLEVFHFLRCILGPVIESFLVLDRKIWMRRELQDTGFVVELVNLFDQRADSARNVAIVIAPGCM